MKLFFSLEDLKDFYHNTQFSPFVCCNLNNFFSNGKKRDFLFPLELNINFFAEFISFFLNIPEDDFHLFFCFYHRLIYSFHFMKVFLLLFIVSFYFVWLKWRLFVSLLIILIILLLFEFLKHALMANLIKKIWKSVLEALLEAFLCFVVEGMPNPHFVSW